MIGYKEFIDKARATLTIFDVDDTLFHTSAKIQVKNGDKIVKTLTSSEYNTYQLRPGETYDYSEFRSAAILSKGSAPIAPMVQKLRAIQKKVMRSPLDRTIIVTARDDFDSKKEVVKFFQSHGIDVDNEVYIERSGKLGGKTHENKKKVFEHYLDTGVYRRVRLYDDAKSNLDALLDLSAKYPSVSFEAYLVDGDTGNIKRYKR